MRAKELEDSGTRPLTVHEKELLDLLVDGCAWEETAKQLDASPTRHAWLAARLMTALGVSSTTALVHLAQSKGFQKGAEDREHNSRRGWSAVKSA